MSQDLYDLPEGWEWKRLGDVTNNEKLDIVDGPFGSNLKSSEYVDEGIPILRLQNIDRFLFINKNIQYITEEKAKQIQRHSFISGDVVITKLGSPLGKACIIPDDFSDGRIVADLVRVRVDERKNSKKFIVYAINSSSAIAQLESQTKGATRPRINLSHVRSLLIPLPPLAEQTRIVEKLDAVLSRIDTAIDELEQSLKLVDAMFKSGLDGVFESLASLHDVVVLSKVVKINSGIALPSIFKESHISGAIPFYKVAQMNNHTEVMMGSEILFCSEISKAHKVTIFPKGSVLIPKRGGAILTNKKRILVEDASYDSNIMGLKANNHLISDQYLFSFMQSINLADFVDASTIPQINNKHIDQMIIPVPPLSEQEKAVQHINALNSHTTQLKTELTAKIGMFNQLKASVLDGAFRGLI